MRSTRPNVDALVTSGTGKAFLRVMTPEWNRLIYACVQWENDWVESVDQAVSRFGDLVDQASETDAAPPPSFRIEISDAMKKDIRTWLSRREVAVWSRVGRTTKDRLRRAIQRGLNEGDSNRQMAARLAKVVKRTNTARIAQTETTGAMNWGQQRLREEIEIEEKEWISTLDQDTRTGQFDHLAPDGQIVKNSKPFIVSGEKLLHPGDGSFGASAGNIIYCRCTSASSL